MLFDKPIEGRLGIASRGGFCVAIRGRGREVCPTTVRIRHERDTSGFDTLVRGAPLDETGEVTMSGGVWVWGLAAREWLACGAFSLSSS